jgi:hypothetical protein
VSVTTNREHFQQTDTNVTELEELRALVEAVVPPEGITGEFEGTFKKIKIVDGIITEFEVEE